MGALDIVGTLWAQNVSIRKPQRSMSHERTGSSNAEDSVGFRDTRIFKPSAIGSGDMFVGLTTFSVCRYIRIDINIYDWMKCFYLFLGTLFRTALVHHLSLGCSRSIRSSTTSWQSDFGDRLWTRIFPEVTFLILCV